MPLGKVRDEARGWIPGKAKPSKGMKHGTHKVGNKTGDRTSHSLTKVKPDPPECTDDPDLHKDDLDTWRGDLDTRRVDPDTGQGYDLSQAVYVHVSNPRTGRMNVSTHKGYVPKDQVELERSQMSHRHSGRLSTSVNSKADKYKVAPSNGASKNKPSREKHSNRRKSGEKEKKGGEKRKSRLSGSGCK